jgi:hypothetical protein
MACRVGCAAVLSAVTSIVAPTIWHTGTHLLIDFVLKRHQLYRHGSGNSFQHCHMDQKSEDPRIWGDFRFSCLRHPRRVAESWARRANLDPYKTMEEFNYQWQRLIDHHHPHMDAYVHVDGPSRDDQVSRMAELTGWDLSCEWPLGKRSGATKQTHSIRIGDCPEVPQQFIDFYYSTLELNA